jgi:hypothetical protein
MSSRYRMIPVDPEIAREVRESMKAPGYGHPAYRSIATGYGPCRVCLQPLAVNQDERILFTFDPFAGREPFPLPGPIFIHAHQCQAPADSSRIPDEIRFIPMTLNAYASGRRLVAQVRITDGQAESILDRLFEDPEVAYVHVRNTEAGCFLLHVDRT